MLRQLRPSWVGKVCVEVDHLHRYISNEIIIIIIITAITEDGRETVFLFQRLSMALQQGNAVAFQNTTSTE